MFKSNTNPTTFQQPTCRKNLQAASLPWAPETSSAIVRSKAESQDTSGTNDADKKGELSTRKNMIFDGRSYFKWDADSGTKYCIEEKKSFEGNFIKCTILQLHDF